jgi:pantothenate kinase
MPEAEPLTFAQLAQIVMKKADGAGRFMLGIAGYPGAGKSTSAAALVEALNAAAGKEEKAPAAVVVPMDGFHRYNAELQALDLLPLKGVPASFDADAFVALLRRIKKAGTTGDTVTCPSFDRAIEEPAPDTISVRPQHKIIVVEGNYLLLDSAPWNEIPEILDEIWFIDCPLSQIEPRLLARHIAGGRDEAGARTKMESTDLPNAKLIEASRRRADRIVSPPPLPTNKTL